MHATSQENMRKCYNRYLDGPFIAAREKVVVLEMGSADVNGSYREIFSHPKIAYCGADIIKGKGVDLALESPYQIPLADAYADVVISGQMLEHCEYFWMMFQEMVRVLKPDGLLFLITPSAGPIHRYPVDCYRFYPDAYEALAKFAKCHLIDSWLDRRGPWKDLVGIFAKARRSRWAGYLWSGRMRLEADRAETYVPQTEDPVAYNEDAELNAVKGSMSYLALLDMVHREIAPRMYLEIGVREGVSLRLARSAAIGIDPQPRPVTKLPESVALFRRTSDEFFELDAENELLQTIDLAFIDGRHQFEYALRDFMNIEEYSSLTSLIVVDDIFPNCPVQAKRARSSKVWTGDVWKLLVCFRRFRPDLILLPVDTSPAGSLLIAGLNPSNRVLIEDYNTIVRHFVEQLDDVPPPEVFQRRNALDPKDEVISDLCRGLKFCREHRFGQETVLERLAIYRKRLAAAS